MWRNGANASFSPLVNPDLLVVILSHGLTWMGQLSHPRVGAALQPMPPMFNMGWGLPCLILAPLKWSTLDGLISIPIAFQIFPNISPLLKCTNKKIRKFFHTWDVLVSSNGAPKSSDYKFSTWMPWCFEFQKCPQMESYIENLNQRILKLQIVACLRDVYFL